MATEMFKGFLEDPEIYRQCKEYWKQTLNKVAGSFNEGGMWMPWQPQYWANGMPIEADGNPVFDAWNRYRNRAIRIVQHEAPDERTRIAAWIDTRSDSEFLPGEELTIRLAFSPEAAELSRRLIELWMSPDTTVSDAEEYIGKSILPFSDEFK